MTIVSSQKLKVGLIGCGGIAHTHARALKASALADFTVAYSKSEASAQKFAETYKLKPYWGGPEVLHKMFEREKLDALVICSPHPAHAEGALAAFEAGVHVLTEKPLAASLADCDAMIRAAGKAGKSLGMISQRRFLPPVRRMKDAITSGRLGKPILSIVHALGWRGQAYYESAAWRGTWDGEGGGVMINQAAHQIDIMLWLMGPVKEVSGMWSNLNHPYIEVEDTAIINLRFKNGALGNLVLSNSLNPALHGKVLVTGESGATLGAQLEGSSSFLPGALAGSTNENPFTDVWTLPGDEAELATWRKEDAEFFAVHRGSEYFIAYQIEDFLQSIIDKRTPLVPGHEGRGTVELLHAVYQSQKTGRMIELS